MTQRTRRSRRVYMLVSAVARIYPLVPSRALPWFESYTDQDWITKMRCDTIANEEPPLTADMIGFTESVV